MKQVLVFFVYFHFFTLNSHAFNLRKAAPDIKGNMINSVFQDTKGLIWIGTNTGISRYDGKKTTQLPGFKGITGINGTTTGEIITETLYGLKIFDEPYESTKTFEMFNNVAFSASDSKGTIFIIQGNGSMYYKTNSQTGFDNIIIPDLMSDQIKLFLIDNTDILRIVTTDGTLRNIEILYHNGIVYLNEKSSIEIVSGVLFCFNSDNLIYVIDCEYKLNTFNLATNQSSFIIDLKQWFFDKGKITAGIVFKNEFYLGFETGLYVIKGNNSVKTLMKTGITCLLKDKFQDLIWIGTAGDGIYTYSYDPYTIKSNLLSDFTPSISKSITAIYLDPSGTLWLGTEGNGIITIPDYSPDDEITDKHILSDKNGLPDNTILSFQKSKYGIWIGCQSGLAFYSDEYKTISKINNNLLKDIHAIYEQDSVFWIACYKKGIAKACITYKNGIPEIRSTKLYSINNGDEASNRFSSIYADNENILFINAGNGIFKFDHHDLTRLTDDKFNSINHVMAINKTNYIASTDFGTLKFSVKDQNIIEEYFLNNTATKDIIPENRNDYWLSTDNGLALYNTKLNIFRYFDHSYGLAVTEYCDGSSFKDEQNDILFFGGINGFTTITCNDYDEAMDYMPVLYPEKLTLFGIDKNINDFEHNRSNGLIFKSHENFFSVTFNAVDYINGNNYTYYYKIADGQWVDNGNSGAVSFIDVSPGHYDLFVKYYNKMLNKESYTRKLSITVLSPWYRSAFAYGIYFLLTLFSIYLIVSSVSKRRRKLKEKEAIKAEQYRKEEIYEAKLDFFTDIAHEFCTPLTLIYGPCHRILEQKNINSSVLKYVNVIDRNAKRMNSLISDLMDFKQIESGHKQPEIKRLNISEIADSVIDVFKINASGSKINIKKRYDAGINWNSDESFLVTILTNLVSNAVKYSEGEQIKVEILSDSKNLKIKVTNKGKGICKEDIENIFNRYAVLNNFEQQGDWRQSGLGLAIVAGMVGLLHGNIDVESVPDDITTFTINLPEIPECGIVKNRNPQVLEPMITNSLSPATHVYKEEWQTVTVVEDDPEMLWFICDVLNDEFNVIPVNNPSIVSEVLLTNRTDIILCDIMMDGISGIEITKTLKSDESTSHIPLIIVSAAHEIEKQTEAINAGAELYVTKPFNIDYLKSVVKRLLGRKEDLKDYFASPLSIYELNMGKLQQAEHRKFFRKIVGVINKNIQNENLSPDFVASELGMSTRSLYRKLKEVTDIRLQEIIREGKLTTAENLLLKSKLTIDEIVYKSGFSNRSSFYRAFSKKNGCSPTEFIEKMDH